MNSFKKIVDNIAKVRENANKKRELIKMKERDTLKLSKDRYTELENFSKGFETLFVDARHPIFLRFLEKLPFLKRLLQIPTLTLV